MKRTHDPDVEEENKRSKGEPGMDEDDPQPIIDVGDVTQFTKACYHLEYGPVRPRRQEYIDYHFDLKNALREQYDVMEQEFLNPTVYTRPKRSSTGPSDIPPSSESKAVQLLKEYRRKMEVKQDLAVKAEISKARTVRDEIADDALSFVAVQVGHGDCSLIKTPLGKIIMIDCGSAGSMNDVGTRGEGAAPDQEVLDQIRSILGTKRTVDVLIMTHADQDHHNQFRWVINSIGITKFGVVYHTDRFDQFKVGNNSDTFASTAVLAVSDKKNVKRVAFNDLGPRLFALSGPVEGVLPPKKAAKGTSLEWTDVDGSLIIHEEKDCTVRIVAAEVDVASNLNYERPALPDTNSLLLNGASIVTLVEGCGQKLLICGDATINTEAFMLRKFTDARLKNITMLRVAHHGSNLHCSGSTFIDHVTASSAVVSTGYKVIGHCFPKVDVLQRCWPHIAASDNLNNVWYWVGTKKLDSQHDDLFTDKEKLFSGDTKKHARLKKKKLWITGSTGYVSLSFKVPA